MCLSKLNFFREKFNGFLAFLVLSFRRYKVIIELVVCFILVFLLGFRTSTGKKN